MYAPINEKHDGRAVYRKQRNADPVMILEYSAVAKSWQIKSETAKGTDKCRAYMRSDGLKNVADEVRSPVLQRCCGGDAVHNNCEEALYLSPLFVNCTGRAHLAHMH